MGLKKGELRPLSGSYFLLLVQGFSGPTTKKLFCLCVPLREENMSERLLISFNSYTYWFSIHILSFHEMEAFTSTLGLLTYLLNYSLTDALTDLSSKCSIIPYEACPRVRACLK